MTATKVSLSIDIEKLKAEKRLTACKCKIEGCENIGEWTTERSSFYLKKDMCTKHYRRFKIHGDVNYVKFIRGEGRIKNPLYITYSSIKARCYNPNVKTYKHYGGRGIKMSDEWLSDFNAFERDMGKKPTPKHSIDREDVSGDYCKENCRWATKHEQAANTRNNNKNVGVSFDKKYQKWNARLGFNGKLVLIKSFDTEQKAIDARKAAEIEYKIYDK